MYAGMLLDGLLVFLSFARGKQIRRVIGTWLRVWNVKRVAFLLFALALLRQRARACEALPNVCFGRIESFSGGEGRMLVYFVELRTHQTTASGVFLGGYYMTTAGKLSWVIASPRGGLDCFGAMR